MKPVAFTVWVSLLSGCLPAYDNQYGLTERDMGGMADASTSNPCTESSSMKISGSPLLIEKLARVNGPVLRIEGCTGAPGTVGVSNPAASSSVFTVIPTAYLNQPRYIILEGDYQINAANKGTVLRNWMAPRITLDGGIRLTSATFHLSSNMGGVRSEIAKELASAGRIPASDGDESRFGLLYTFAFGALAYFTEPIDEIGNTTFSLDDGTGDDATRDKSSCDPTKKCCLYYSNHFDEFFHDPKLKPTLLDLNATKSPTGYFAVVCPIVGTGDQGEVKLTQTATTVTNKQSNYMASIPATTASPFPPFSIPRKPNEAVTVEYFIQQ